MARKGLTYQEVARAADELRAAGAAVTIRGVRERLGDTGSPNTIHRLLNEWRGQHGDQARAVTAYQVPERIAAAITAEIEARASQVRAELEAEIDQVRAEAAELARAGEALEEEAAELRAELEKAKSEADRLRGAYLEIRTASELMREEMAEMRTREQKHLAEIDAGERVLLIEQEEKMGLALRATRAEKRVQELELIVHKQQISLDAAAASQAQAGKAKPSRDAAPARTSKRAPRQAPAESNSAQG